MRLAVLGAALLISIGALCGCSGSHSDAGADQPGVGARSEGGAAAASPGSRSTASTASTGAGGTKAPGSGSESGPEITRLLPRPNKAVSYSFAPADQAGRRRFAAASKPLQGTYASLRVYTASAGGTELADLAVFEFPVKSSSDSTFRGQIVSQLVSQTTGTQRLRYEGLKSYRAAVGQARSAGVGFFTGNRAVIVLARPTGTTKARAAVAAQVAYAYAR